MANTTNEGGSLLNVTAGTQHAVIQRAINISVVHEGEKKSFIEGFIVFSHGECNFQFLTKLARLRLFDNWQRNLTTEGVIVVLRQSLYTISESSVFPECKEHTEPRKTRAANNNLDASPLTYIFHDSATADLQYTNDGPCTVLLKE